MWDRFAATLDDAYQAARSYRPNKADWLEGHWTGLTRADDEDEREEATAVTKGTLQKIGIALAHVPEGFDIDPKIAR